MTRPGIFFFLFISLFCLPAFAGIAEKIVGENAKLSIILDGKEQEIVKEDVEHITAQLVKIFNTCALSTDDPRLKAVWETNGKTIASLWASYREKSYFSLTYDPPGNVKEMVIPIKSNSLGTVFAETAPGTIKGYMKCNGLELAALYCAEITQKYLTLPRTKDPAEKSKFNCEALGTQK